MKKIWLIIANLFIFSTFIIQALPRNEYPAVQVAFIPSGEAEQEVDCFLDVKAGGIGHESPTTYTIGPDEKIYIADDRKRRIAIYDLNGNYIRQINSKKVYLGNLIEIKVTKDGKIFGIDAISSSLIKISAEGELIYIVEPRKLSLKYMSKEYFPYEDYLFYYDRKHKIRCLNPQGEAMTDEETNNLLANIKAKEEKTKGVRSVTSFQTRLDKFLKKEAAVIIDNKLFSYSIFTEKRYWDLFNTDEKMLELKRSNFIKTIKESDARSTPANIKGQVFITEEDMQKYIEGIGGLIGYDRDGNSIWEGAGMIVMDKYYNVIDAFKVTGAKISYPMQVAPNGDFYFWQKARDGITFYKVTRRW